MNESTPAAIGQASPNPPTRNPAVIHCCQVWESSLQYSHEKKMDRYDTKQRANMAYRNAMPDLSGYENIRDFIACTAHGMLIGVVDSIEGPKLLYAAQVALGTLRHEPKEPKRSAA